MSFIQQFATLGLLMAFVACTPGDGRQPPGAPTGVVAVAGDSEATVTWAAPANQGSSAITGYTVTTSPSGIKATSSGLSVKITGLTNGTLFTFTVHATNAAGDGPESTASAPISPSFKPNVPAAPTAVVAVPGDAQATVTWAAPTNDGGASLSGYTVTTIPGGATTPVSGTTAVVGQLVNGTAYTFTVHASNIAGNSAESAPSTPVIPQSTVPTVPGAPTNVVAVAGNGQVTLTWAAPTSTGGSEITGYTVVSSRGGLTISTNGATSVTLSGLTNGIAYSFTVHATNVVGDSPESEPSATVIPATVPAPPTDVIAAAGDGQASVSWLPANDGGRTILSYSVTIHPGETTLTTTETSMAYTGLANGTAYSFSVAATNAVGTGAATLSNEVTPMVPLVVPGAPGNVVAVRGNGSATVSWSAPGSDGGTAITGYTVTSTPGGATSTTTGTSATLSGLNNGTSYTFQVQATNAIGNGPPSLVSNAVIPATVPGAPTGVVAAAGNASATLTWTVPDAGGSAIVGYVVTAEPGARVVPTATTSATIEGLTNGVSYTFSVHAVNDVGDGVESSLTAPVIPMTAPGAPADLVATPGDAAALLTWTAPETDGGSAILGYLITASDPAITLSVGVQTSATVPGLTNGTRYSFTIHAINGVGAGAESATSNEVTPVRALQLPGAPSNVAAVSGDAQATVTFAAPASDGGTEIVSYIVTTYPGGATTTVTTLSATIGSLTNGVGYSFTVRAQNSVGIGPESSASNVVTPVGVPNAPTQVVAVAEAYRATITWLPPANDGGSEILGYTVTVSPGGATLFAIDTTVIATALTNGVTYTFTVHATNALGDGPESAASNEVNPAALPGAPTGVSAVASNGAATVTWTAPVDDGGRAITGYVVVASPGGITASTTGENSVVVPGLVNGTAYTFIVHAITSEGQGGGSDPSNEVTPQTVPDAPSNVVAVPGQYSATVSWTAPARDGGRPILAYTVTAIPGGSTVTTGATTATLSGLANGFEYTFVVHATTAAGDGPEATSNAVTPALLPGAPTHVSATGRATLAVVVWDAPMSDGGSPITGYVVTMSPGGLTQTTTDTTAVFPNLTAGSHYSFTVHATNAIGAGPESAPTATVYSGAHVPGAPTNIGVGVGFGEVLVSWDPPEDDGGAPITNYYVASHPGPFFALADGAATSVPVTVTNGVTYTFTVFAINAVGSGATSDPSVAVTPGSTPGAPQNANAVAANGSAMVSWSAPANDGGAAISSYTVTTYPGGATATTADTSLVVTGLANGTSYSFTIHATTAVGSSQESAPSNAVTPVGPPGTPEILSVAPGDGQASVIFAPPTDDGGSPITSYIVTASPGGASIEIPVADSGPSRGGPSRNGLTSAITFTAIVTGLSNGTSYTFVVIAVNGYGRGPDGVPSAPVVPGASPGAPRSVLATAGNGQATVSWSVPLSTGDAPITRYTVTSNPGAFVGTTSGATTLTMTGLTNGVDYTFIVVASNIFGSGPASSPSSAVTPSIPTTPGAPTNLLATAGSGQATISWNAPVSDGGSTITGYTVTSSGGQTATTTGALTATVSGLTNGTTYTFTVTATNAAGTSVDSAPSAGVTPATVPGAPTNVNAIAGNALATVSWTAPFDGGSAIQSYTVTASPGGLTATTAATSASVTGLTNGTTYTFTVKATNASGIGASSIASAGVTPNTVPGAPTNVAATAANGQATVTWTAPTNAGTAITGYTVTSSGGQTATTVSATSTTFTGLTNGTAYSFTVHATNSAGNGAESAPSSAVTPSTIPNAPTGASAAPGNQQVTVTWTAPTFDGGRAITGYTITASPGGRTATTTGATSATVTALTNGNSYSFTVRATNANGTGAASSATTVVIPNVVPNPPTSVVATPGDTSVAVSWTAPTGNGGTAITGYTVTSSGGQTATTTGATSVTVSGLTNYVSYTFTVVATNAFGSSAASSASSAAIPRTTPVILASGQLKPWAIRVDSNSVYWTNDNVAGNVMKVARAGGTPLTIAGSRTSAYDIALDSTSIYWVEDKANGNVMKAPLGGGTLTTLVTGLASPSFLAVDTVSVYWSNYWDNSVMKTAIGGGAVTTLVTGTNGPFTVISDASKVYWTGEGASGLIRSVGLNGGTVLTINGDSTQGTNGIAVDATTMYWARQDGAILKRPLAGGAYVTLASGQNLARGVALDATYVYWANGGGSIARVPTAGGSTITLASGLSSPNAIVVDGSTAYWTDSGNGRVMKLTYGPTVAPGTPTAPVATAGPVSATVSWRAPFDGGSAITQYTVTSSPGGFSATTSGATTATVTGLTSGTSYTFVVTAKNSVGTGPGSVASNAVVPTAAVPLTHQATNVVASVVNRDSIHVTWTAPTDPAIVKDKYLVTAHLSGAGYDIGSLVSANATSADLTSLPTDAITVTVSTWSNALQDVTSTSDPSNSVTPLCGSDDSCALSGLLCNSSGTCVAPCTGGVGCNTCTNWDLGGQCYCGAGGACLDDECANTNNCAGNIVAHVCDTATHTCVECMNNDSDCGWGGPGSPPYCVGHQCGWCASNAGCNPSRGGPHCDGSVCEPAVEPASPTSVSAIAGAGQATVSWTAPADDGGSAITGYTVTSTLGDLTATTTGATSATVSGLAFGTSYTFTVHATNAVGNGTESAASNVVTSTSAITVPAAPTNVQATAGDGLVTVTWTAPVSNGGSAITGYTVTSTPDGVTATTTGATSVEVSDLTNGTSYTFTVHATNAVGDSLESEPSASVTPVAACNCGAGLVCDGEGGCVQCVQDGDCDSFPGAAGPYCTYGVCSECRDTSDCSAQGLGYECSLDGAYPDSPYRCFCTLGNTSACSCQTEICYASGDAECVEVGTCGGG